MPERPLRALNSTESGGNQPFPGILMICCQGRREWVDTVQCAGKGAGGEIVHAFRKEGKRGNPWRRGEIDN